MKLPIIITSRIFNPSNNMQPGVVPCLVSTNSRFYCDGKSIYQRNEEGKRTRKVYGEPYPDWRNPWVERKGEFRSKLAAFNEKNPNMEILNALQKLPNLDLQQVKDWWKNMKIIQEIENQKYLQERVNTLGANLAAMHFFTHRNAAIRLKDSKEWLTGNALTLEDQLPKIYVEGYYVEAIDCSNFHHNGIRYEGLLNLMGLNFLKYLSLKDQIHIDAWCLDRIAGLVSNSLEYLDISSCDLDLGCVFALAKMRALKTLVIKDPGNKVETQAALSYLEQEKNDLQMKVVDFSEDVWKLPN